MYDVIVNSAISSKVLAVRLKSEPHLYALRLYSMFRLCRMLYDAVTCHVINRQRMPFMGQPDYRVYEMNRRLQQWTEVAPFCFNFSDLS